MLTHYLNIYGISFSVDVCLVEFGETHQTVLQKVSYESQRKLKPVWKPFVPDVALSLGGI
jgi:hypothetical protein